MNVSASYFNILNHLSPSELSPEAFLWIPSVRYSNEISKTVSHLSRTSIIDFICPTVVLGNGDVFYYTCNNPILASAYSSTLLCKIDNYFKIALQKNKSHFYPMLDYDDADTLQKNIIDILSNKFGIHNAYCLVRPCDDLTLVVGIGTREPISHYDDFFKNTYRLVEKTLIDYFNKLMPLYIEQCPSLKNTQFAKDARYRENVISGEFKPSHIDIDSITPREAECLYWSSKGKNSAEIADIMNISKYTVTEHKKSIMLKLNSKNMVNAVYKAIKYNLIA